MLDLSANKEVRILARSFYTLTLIRSNMIEHALIRHGYWKNGKCTSCFGFASPLIPPLALSQSLQEMFECLVKHGCPDLTSSADASRSSEVITSGGFGDVRRLEMHDGTVVAIKTLRLHVLRRDDDKAVKVGFITYACLVLLRNVQQLQRAVREIYFWSRLRHVNVQQLLGIVIFRGGLGMVSPWMERGDLRQYIDEHPNVDRYPLVCPTLAMLYSSL